MTDRKVMQQALEALIYCEALNRDVEQQKTQAITALKAALEQQAEPVCPECKAALLYECIGCSSNNYPPQQQAEPVAWVCMNGEKHDIDFDQPEIDAIPVGTFLYTTPPKRPWVGLTPEEVLDLFDLNNVYGSKWIEFARTVEAALRSKNT